MSSVNRRLAVLAAVLLVLSFLVYRQGVVRADRFERGQKFLSQLDPDEVGEIAVRRGDESVTLRRQGEDFVILEAEGYPARNEAVNRLLRDLLELTLEKEVGTGEDLQRELEIEPPAENTVEVSLTDLAEQEMVRFRVGRALEGGSGRYVKRLDRAEDPVYLTSGGISPSTTVQGYLRQQILDVPRSAVERVEGSDFVLERRDGGDLELIDQPAGSRQKRAEIGGLEGVLSALRFEEVHLADAAEVAGLEFLQALDVALDDGSGYLLSTASRAGRTYLRITGYHTVGQVAITMDEAEEELAEKAEVLSRADEMDEFNRFHGSWVYEVGETTAERLGLRRAQLVEADGASAR